jgi:hypothetical protein
MGSFAQQVWQRDEKAQEDQRAMQLMPLQEALRADQTRLALYADPDDPSKPLVGKEAQYRQTLDRMTQTIGQMRRLYGQKPQGANPVESGVGSLLDSLHITNHLKNHVAQVRAQNAANYAQQNQVQAGEYAAAALPYAMTPEGQKAAYARQTAIDVANARGTMKEYASPDGKERNWFRPGEEPSGWQAIQPGGKGYLRQSTHVVTPQDAISLMQSTGQQYLKQDGTPWTAQELAKFPKGTVLAGFVEGDNMFYAPFDQRTKTATIGNLIVQLPEAGQITPSTENPLGVARVPTVTTHQVPGMNPGEVINLTTREVPQTVGAGVPSAAAPNTAPKKTEKPAQTTPSGPVQQRLKARAAIERGDMPPEPKPFAPGTFLTQGRTVEPVISSMRVVGAQIFGGNGQPPIWKYADLYDDPDMAQALNKALTMNSLTMPGVREEPGLWETLATAAGVTGWSQEQINQAAVDARKQVQQLGGEDAMKFLSRLMGFQEDLSALRTATRASSAQGSIQTLVRAAPIYNVSSAQNFRDQLATTLNTAAAAMSGYPVINPQFVDWFSLGAKMAEGESPKTQPAASQYRVGQKVKLKNGQTITIKHVYADGSFD